MDLHKHTLPSFICVANFGDSVSWSPDFEEHFTRHGSYGRWRDHKLGIFCIACRSTSKIRLMFLALGVSEIRALIGVECKTQPAFERSKMIPKNIGILAE
jgi:hypothetical protein